MEKFQVCPKTPKQKVYFVCEDKCICLTSPNGQVTSAEEVDELKSSQEEADTRIILCCLHIAGESAMNSIIIIRSPDTDVMYCYCTLSKK